MFGKKKTNPWDVQKTEADIEGETYEAVIINSIYKYLGYAPLHSVLLKRHKNDMICAEIDLLLITPAGIMPIECKSRKRNDKEAAFVRIGLIRDWAVAPWTSQGYASEDIIQYIPNPWLQNALHLEFIQKYMNEANLPIKQYYNVVCVSAEKLGLCEYGRYETGDTILLAEDHLIAIGANPGMIMYGDSAIKSFCQWIKESAPVYTQQEVKEITNYFKQFVGTEDDLSLRKQRIMYERSEKDPDYDPWSAWKD